MLFCTEVYDLHIHIYTSLSRSPSRAPIQSRRFTLTPLPPPPHSAPSWGRGAGFHRRSPTPPGRPLFHEGQPPSSPPSLERGGAEGRQHPLAQAAGRSALPAPRAEPSGRAGSSGRAGCAPRGANSRLRAANERRQAEVAPNFPQPIGWRGGGGKKRGKEKKKERKRGKKKGSQASCESLALLTLLFLSILPPAPPARPAPPRLPSRARREPGPRRDSPPAALTPRISPAGRGSPGGRGAESPAPPAAEQAAPLKYLRARLPEPHSSHGEGPTRASRLLPPPPPPAAAAAGLRARVPPPRSRDRAAPCLRTCCRRR